MAFIKVLRLAQVCAVASTLQPERRTEARAELCYNLRYYEENGRESGNPWSLRQTAIYHRYDIGQGCWTWFLIQPSHLFHSQLITDLSQVLDDNSRRASVPALLHNMHLTLGLSSFGDYIDSLHSEVVRMVCSGVLRRNQRECANG